MVKAQLKEVDRIKVILLGLVIIYDGAVLDDNQTISLIQPI